MKTHNGDSNFRYSDQEKGKQVFRGQTKTKPKQKFTTHWSADFPLLPVSPWEAVTPVITTAFQSLGEQQALGSVFAELVLNFNMIQSLGL